MAIILPSAIRRNKEKRIRLVRIASPDEVRIKIRFEGASYGPSIKLEKTGEGVIKKTVTPTPVTGTIQKPIKDKKTLKGIKKLLKSLPSEKTGTEFQLPTISITTAQPVDISTLDVLEGPITFKGLEFTKIYITKDSRYIISDPILTEAIRSEIEAALDYIFFQTDSEKIAKAIEDKNFLDNLLREFDISPEARYLIKREIFGYGVLEPIIRDPRIEDFQIPAAGIPGKILHRDYGELESNIVFTEYELNRFIEKLMTRIKHSISLFRPMASVQLPEGHRLTVAYQKEVTTRGPALVLRKFPEKPWSISMLLEKNALSPEMAAWLMLMVENKKGIMIIGPMGSGKTSAMNAICNFIPRMKTIVTIEDTPEIRLYHPYWIQHKTRESLTIGGFGEISMFDLVKHALRESADYMIIGEVRGEEGKIWAQAIATGHGGITTFHAESPEAMIARLTSPPISVEKSLLTALRTIVKTGRLTRYEVDEHGKRTPKTIRRIVAIYDYNYDPIHDKSEIIQIYKYNYNNDSFQTITPIERTKTAQQIMEYKGWSTADLLKEYELRTKLFSLLKEHLDKMKELGIESPLLDYIEVTKLLWKFSENPEASFQYIKEIEDQILLSKRKKPRPTESKNKESKIRLVGIRSRRDFSI